MRRPRLPTAPAALLGLAAWAAAAAGGGAATEAAKVREVAVVGAAFRVTLADGRVLTDDELVGAVIEAADDAGRQLVVRIDGHRKDPLDPSGETVLYDLSTPDAAVPGGWTSLCGPGPDGTRAAFPLAGAWSATGERLPADPAAFAITCTSGAIGKCVRLGYRPWRAGPDGASLRDHHQACVRLLRADYCGDGVGHTRDGTRVDLFDRIGVQRPEELPAPGMAFEAAWGPEGATCVRRTRVPDILDLDGLARACPRLAGRLGEGAAGCDEASAPGLLLVRSRGSS